MQWFEQAWLLFGKMWALAFIFVGGCLLATVILPILTVFPDKSRERAQFFIHHSFRFYLYILQLFGFIRLEIKDIQSFSNCGGKMVIANHPSLLDVVILMALIPRSQCIVKHELWKHPLLGSLMRKAGYIRNDLDPEKLIEACQSSLNEGRCLIIFPEGTRTPPQALPHFHRGFANIATLTEAPIQLVFLTCTPPFLFKGEPWWHVPQQKPFFRVTLGEQLDAAKYSLYGQRALNARKLVESLEHYYAAQTRTEQP